MAAIGKRISAGVFFLVVLTQSGCMEAGGSRPVTGSAGGQTSIGANGIARCPRTLGTLAVDDGREQGWYGPFYSATRVTSIEPMVRLVVQQSNCFTITSIGNNVLEAKLSRITGMQRSGEFRAGSRQERGQRMAADYFLEPAIIFGESNTGGMAGSLGGLIPGRYGSVFSTLAGGMNQSATTVTMSLFDIRAQSQMAASEGNSTSSSFGAALAGFGGRGGGALSAYQQTPAGQATVAAFVDAYNKLVDAVINYRAQDIAGGAGTGGVLRPQGR